jgi:hypothetical protein
MQSLGKTQNQQEIKRKIKRQKLQTTKLASLSVHFAEQQR